MTKTKVDGPFESLDELIQHVKGYKPTFLDRIRWAPKRASSMYYSIRNEIKHRRARRRQGWSHMDVWSWDTWHAEIVAQSLEHYADVCHGWPGDDWGTFEEYVAMIREIAAAYRGYLEVVDGPPEINGEYDFEGHRTSYDKAIERLKNANILMAENYGSIWD